MGEWPGALGAATDPELEQALIALGRHVAYPATPDIAGRVRTTLEREPTDPSSPNRGARRGLSLPLVTGRTSQLGFVAASLLVAIIACVALFPDMRTAIADRLGLRGVRICWLEDAPPPPTPLGEALMLGRPVTLAEAQAAVDFPVLMPAAAGYVSPREIYVSGEGSDAMISFVYGATPDLPAASEIGAAALLTQFGGHTERALIEKGLQGPSGTSEPETLLEPVTVRGEPGFWISGAPHAVFYVCSGPGECRQEPYRLAGDVLLWEHEGVTLRLESVLSRDAALAIAESVRPVEQTDVGTFSLAARYIGLDRSRRQAGIVEPFG